MTNQVYEQAFYVPQVWKDYLKIVSKIIWVSLAFLMVSFMENNVVSIFTLGYATNAS